MEVLKHYSLKHELSEDDLKEVSKGLTNYAQGLSLALKVLGSFLLGKKKLEWRSHLDKLKGIVNQPMPQISYDR